MSSSFWGDVRGIGSAACIFTYWPDINPLLMILINFTGFATIAILLTELMRRIHCGFIIGE